MIRLLGHNLLNKQPIYIALTKIYGIGLSTSKKILKNLNIELNIKVKNLTTTQFSLLRTFLEKESNCFEGNLKKNIKLNIKHLIEINCYRGKRHLKYLPVNGQRTRTNSRTVRKKILLFL